MYVILYSVTLHSVYIMYMLYANVVGCIAVRYDSVC